jgi:hypothetical protein
VISSSSHGAGQGCHTSDHLALPLSTAALSDRHAVADGSVHEDARRREIRLGKRPMEDVPALQSQHRDYALTALFISLNIMYIDLGMLSLNRTGSCILFYHTGKLYSSVST